MTNSSCVSAAVGLILAVASAGCGPSAEAIEQDRKRLAGEWRIVAFQDDGDSELEKEAKKVTVVNQTDGTWKVRFEDQETVRGTSTIDPTQNPKTIDFTAITEGEGQGLYLGIYELGETSRRLCFAHPGKKRPTEFASRPGSGYVLITFERQQGK